MVMPVLRQHHLLMVRLPEPGRESLHFPIEKGQIVRVNASYINANNGEIVANLVLHLTGPQDLHFAASHKECFAGWWYLQEWDRSAKSFKCSCLEGKSTGFCQHIEALGPAFTVV